MINDIYNNPKFELSYTNESGGISVLKKDVQPYTFRKNKYASLKSWNGYNVSRMEENKFDEFSIRHFLYRQDEQKTYFKRNTPKLYAADIEVDITKTNNDFPNITEAKAPINLITVTDENLETIAFCLSDEHRSFEDTDINTHLYIQDKIYAHLYDDNGDCRGNKVLASLLVKLGITKENPPKVSLVWFDDEYEMLKAYHKFQRDVMHTSVWWNNEEFDSIYIHNRSVLLEQKRHKGSSRYSLESINKGIAFNGELPEGHIRSIASPTNKCIKRGSIMGNTSSARYELNSKPQTYKPLHRIELDLKTVVEMFLRRKEKSLKLDVVANEFIGIGKVSYKGSFDKLITGDTNTFLFYGCIDTITLMLMEKVKRLSSQVFTSAVINKTELSRAFHITKKTTDCFTDYFQEEMGLIGLKKDYEDREEDEEEVEEVKSRSIVRDGHHNIPNVIHNPHPDFYSIKENKTVKKGYQGAWVISPRLRRVGYSTIQDASQLYPRIAQSLNCSPENFKGVLGEDYTFEEAKEHGFHISYNGNLYGSQKDSACKVIWTRKVDQRYANKYLMLNLEQVFLPAIEKELKKRLDKK